MADLIDCICNSHSGHQRQSGKPVRGDVGFQQEGKINPRTVLGMPGTTQSSPTLGLRVGDDHQSFPCTLLQVVFCHTVGRVYLIKNQDLGTDDLRTGNFFYFFQV